MANISLTIKSDFEQASRDFRALVGDSEAVRAKVEQLQKTFKSEQIDKFLAKNRLMATGIRATQGPLAAVTAETAGLQRKIQSLIAAGLDPEDAAVKRLRTEYAQLSAQKASAGRSFNPANLLNFTAAIGGLYAVMRAGGVAWNSFIQPAMQAEEAASKFNAIFGAQGEAVRAWAETFGSQIGRSSRALQGFAADMMAIVSPLGVSREAAIGMSEGLVQVAQDISSFHNVDVSEAFNALRSGITGETEPLKRFSILLTDSAMREYALTQGIRKKISEMSIAEKTTLRYNMILASMGAAQGDAARTAGSTTNRLRALSDEIDDLSVSIGSALLPALNSTLDFFANQDSAINQYRASIKAGGDQVIDVTKALAAIAWRSAAEGANDFSDNVGAVVDYLSPVGEAIGTVTSAIGDFIGNMEAAKSIKSIAGGIGDGFSWIGDQVGRVDWGNIFSGQFIIAANDAARGVDRVNSSLAGTPRTATQARGALVDLANNGYNAVLASLRRVDQQSVTSGANRAERARRDLEQRMNFETQWLDRVREGLVAEAETREEAAALRLEQWKSEYGQALEAARKHQADRTNIDAYYTRQRIRIEQEESERRTRQAVEFSRTIVSNMHSAFSDLLIVMEHYGQKSKALVLTIKSLAVAEAAINSYLAFTSVLKDPTIWPSWLRVPLAGSILAAGLAKSAAIAATPVSAETGITNYTVPEIRTNRNDNAPVMASAGEQVTVTPRGEGTESVQRFQFFMNREVLWDTMQQGINTGHVRINTRRNLGKSVFA